MPLDLALDIGGTKFLAGVAETPAIPDTTAEAGGGILRRLRAPAPPGLQQGLDLLHDMARRLADGDTFAGIGVAIGGPLDWRSGVVSPLHQPSWRDVPLKAILEAAFGCPCWLDVDTNVAALGEYAAHPQPPARLLYLTLSTGMGGGFIVDGRIYRGAGGAHPEVGHQSVPFRSAHPERVECECGAPGCLEALVSGNAIRRIYGKPAENLAPEEWNEVAYNLGQGMRNLAAIYLPDEIVLGGGVAVGGGAAFIEQAAAYMRAGLRLVPAPRVRLSRLGYDTALLGALRLARLGQA